MVASLAEILLSRILEFAQRVITPLVSGIVVTLIGLTLVKVGLISIGGETPLSPIRHLVDSQI